MLRREHASHVSVPCVGATPSSYSTAWEQTVIIVIVMILAAGLGSQGIPEPRILALLGGAGLIATHLLDRSANAAPACSGC